MNVKPWVVIERGLKYFGFDSISGAVTQHLPRIPNLRAENK